MKRKTEQGGIPVQKTARAKADVSAVMADRAMSHNIDAFLSILSGLKCVLNGSNKVLTHSNGEIAVIETPTGNRLCLSFKGPAFLCVECESDLEAVSWEREFDSISNKIATEHSTYSTNNR